MPAAAEKSGPEPSRRKRELDYEKEKRCEKRIALALALVQGLLSLILLRPGTVRAANFLFITDLRLAAGEDAFVSLEEEGCNVMAVGLNSGVSEEQQVYLGYKLNSGTPVTNVINTDYAGDSYQAPDGIAYSCAGNVDVDEGLGGGAGCVYFTTDQSVGEPLVGLDVLRADAGSEEELLAIPNDGSEAIRHPDGTPADLEPNSGAVRMYLVQIRDGLVRPYISEIAIITEQDR